MRTILTMIPLLLTTPAIADDPIAITGDVVLTYHGEPVAGAFLNDSERPTGGDVHSITVAWIGGGIEEYHRCTGGGSYGGTGHSLEFAEAPHGYTWAVLDAAGRVIATGEAYPVR